MKKTFSSALVLLLSVLFIFTGCNPAPSNNGSVKIYLADASSKAINPDGAASWAGLGIDSYELVISNNGEAVYSNAYAELPEDAIELSLPVGKYDFAANAYAGDVLVAKAEKNGVVVSSRSNAQVNLVIDAFGTGDVEVAFSFAEGSVSNGNISAILTNLATKAEIEMTVEDGKVVANDVPVGSYILDLIADVKLVGTELAEEKAGVFIKSDIVYVENGKTSSALWTIKYEGNKASISIDSNVGEPVDFTIQVVGDNAEFDAETNTYYIPVDTPIVLKAVGNNIDDYAFEWDFDGVKTNGSEVVISYDSFDLGKLSLLVTAKAGSTYGYGYNAWTIESTDFINGTFFVGTADRLAKFASEVNAGNPLFTKGNIVLVADIDLENNAWTPIGNAGNAKGKTFSGTFDGQGYTISNLTVAEGTEYAGLFGYTNSATIKNVNFENVKLDGVTRGGALAAVFRSGLVENVNVENVSINASRQSGGVVGAFYGKIKNSSVKNAALSLIPDGVEGAYDNGDKVGGIAGLSQSDNNSGLIENCIVENITLKAYRDAGIIIGAADGYILDGNTVKGDNSIVIDQVTNFYGAKDFNAGTFVGRNFDATEIVDSNAYAADATYDYIVKASRAGALDDVLKLDAREIYVFLTGDATINANDAYLKLGAANTEEITIEGSGAETLELATTYWSRVNTTNDDAKLVLKNLKLTSSQPTGTWNSYDITFQCDVELEDVDCLKAVALDDTSYASFKDVTISETHDYYALWISTDNDVVDIDGLTVTSTGRGIKIDDQYVGDDSRRVTLNVKNSTFNTAKKSAIIVKSPFGADITADNIDISNVAADPINAVWVDEDAAAYADLVAVYGCTKKVEGALVNDNGEYGVDTNDANSFKEIIADVNNVAGAEATVVVPAGEVVLPSDLGNADMKLSVLGAGIDNTTVNGTPNSYGNTNSPGNYAHGKDLYFKDLTYVTPNSGYQGGFGHAKSVTFENCKIVGQFYCHSGAPHKFINCTIDPLNGYLYTYASDCEFIDCTFVASEGKALQVYEDSAIGSNKVVIDGCTFVAAKQATTWDGKPVTPIDINSNGASFEVIINNCTSTGFPKGLNSNSDLWNVKNTALDVFKVTVDGVQVYPL